MSTGRLSYVSRMVYNDTAVLLECAVNPEFARVVNVDLLLKGIREHLDELDLHIAADKEISGG
jgi:hypothetical protein